MLRSCLLYLLVLRIVRSRLLGSPHQTAYVAAAKQMLLIAPPEALVGWRVSVPEMGEAGGAGERQLSTSLGKGQQINIY